MLDHLDHVGFIVRDIDQALPYYVGTLGLTVASEECVPDAGVRLIYLDAGNTLIQLVQPITNAPMLEFLSSRGEGLHHVCFAVDDIDAAVAHLAPGADVRVDLGGRGRRCAFLPVGPSGIIAELTEIEPFDANGHGG
ncbi:MAG: VOC family protein [Thermomicrobiales bacterium]